MIRMILLALSTSAAAWSVQARKDPCTLFTKAELEAAFGYPLQPARPDASLQICSFNGRNNPNITIGIPNETTTAREFDEFIRMTGDEGEKITGVGDAAFILLSRIYVRVGARSVTISAGLEKTSPKVRTALIAIGKTAATRLK